MLGGRHCSLPTLPFAIDAGTAYVAKRDAKERSEGERPQAARPRAPKDFRQAAEAPPELIFIQ